MAEKLAHATGKALKLAAGGIACVAMGIWLENRHQRQLALLPLDRDTSIHPDEAPDLPYTPTQFQRAEAAMSQFVEPWNLPLNPPEIDLMTYAVLREACSDQPLESIKDYEQLEAGVDQLIEHHEGSARQLGEAMQRSIDNRRS